jgi:hypothetical protein
MTNPYQETVAVAERVLAAALARPATLHLTEAVVDYPGAAAIILRCRLDRREPGHPASVIVKRSNAEQQHIFREWANLEFLLAIPDARPLVPSLYGGDVEAELLVLEDLGDPRQRLLGNVIEADDPVRAEMGLIAFQRALGRLHAATAGAASAYARVSVRRNANTISRHTVHRLPELLAALPSMFASAGVTTDERLADEIGEMVGEIVDPGPFHTFVHGDAAVGNVFYDGADGARLIDFETGAFRHALLDGCFARMRYLFSVWARWIPLPLQRRLTAAYRDELIARIPEASDAEQFNRALLACSAAWLAAIVGYLPTVTAEDRRFGRSTYRQRIVTALDHYVQLSDDVGGIGPLTYASNDLARRLRRCWSADERVMQPYNAFARG